MHYHVYSGRVWHPGGRLAGPDHQPLLAAQSIYQIITDRFFDGDPSNNNADGNYSATGTTSVHGGDFKGIEQKLDYIKALGATAIWISPVVLNGHGQFHGYAGAIFTRWTRTGAASRICSILRRGARTGTARH